MSVIGYARVSTKAQVKGNSFEEQETALKDNGCTKIYTESYTGTKTDRPIFNNVIKGLNERDTLMVTKLDRFARSAAEGIQLIRELTNKGIRVHILNMGVADNTPMGKLMITVLSGFAEYERDMIVERTQLGKAIARTKEGFKEGRPKKYTKKQIEVALELLKEHSFTQVEKMTKISKSTLVREKRKMKVIESEC